MKTGVWKSLVKKGETTTYYLLNDLTFTEEESTQVQMIGKYKKG